MKKLYPWYGAAAILFVIFGTIYIVVQQVQRNDANYPQIQIAEDTAARLNQGAKPPSLTNGKVDIKTSLAPFTIIYDKSGNIVSGEGYLDGSVAEAPFGILKNAENHPYHWISWQPEGDVRIAAVTVSANKYYVLSGRNLKEVEKYENDTFQLSFLGGVISLIILSMTYKLYEGSGIKKK
ncbi:MAG: hypothetical protein ACHQT9_03700 [Candidatus Saccharimonadales bacterium]